MNQFCFYVAIAVIIASFAIVPGDAASNCSALSNHDCDFCLSGSKCGYCTDTKLCFSYDTSIVDFKIPCDINNLKWPTCVGNLKIWIIVGSVLGGILLIAIIAVITCIWCKCKRRAVRKEQARQDKDDQRMDERRAAAEVRAADRTKVADQIRMKYGILKEKENSTDYKRMS